MTKTNMTNPEKDHFNKSLPTSLNGQQHLQKQSLYMMQDIEYRHGYINLKKYIPIYEGKIWN